MYAAILGRDYQLARHRQVAQFFQFRSHHRFTAASVQNNSFQTQSLVEHNHAVSAAVDDEDATIWINVDISRRIASAAAERLQHFAARPDFGDQSIVATADTAVQRARYERATSSLDGVAYVYSVLYGNLLEPSTSQIVQHELVGLGD